MMTTKPLATLFALPLILFAPVADAQTRPNPNLSGAECRDMWSAYQKLADQYGGVSLMARRQVRVVDDLIQDINATPELRAALVRLRDAHSAAGPNFDDLGKAFQAAADAFRACSRATH
jgi:hypothetical protein